MGVARITVAVSVASAPETVAPAAGGRRRGRGREPRRGAQCQCSVVLVAVVRASAVSDARAAEASVEDDPDVAGLMAGLPFADVVEAVVAGRGPRAARGPHAGQPGLGERGQPRDGRRRRRRREPSVPERGHPQQRGQPAEAQGLHRRGGVRPHCAHRPRGRRELHQHHLPQAARDPRLPAPLPGLGSQDPVDALSQPGGHQRTRADDELRPGHLRDG